MICCSTSLLDISKINKIDKGGIYKIYDVWPKIAREELQAAHTSIEYTGIDHIVFSGMGGSGAIGDLFSAILSKTDIHVSLTKGYHIPKTVDKNTLVVVTSVSGNTVETLSALVDAAKTDCKIIAFSSGGKMEQYCKKNNIQYERIEKIHSPRASFIKYVYHILGSLDNTIPIKKSDVTNSISAMKNISQQINSQNLSPTNPSLDLARWIRGTPVIYYPWGLQASAIRFKNSLQENAKLHAMAEDIVEACHNGIVSWERKSKMQPILIEGKNDYAKTRERWKIIHKYFEQNGIEYRIIRSVSGSILAKLTCLIYVLDYASIYNAILHNIDPSPVKSIDYVKARV